MTDIGFEWESFVRAKKLKKICWNVIVYTAIFCLAIHKSESFTYTRDDWKFMENSHFCCTMLEELCGNLRRGKHKNLKKICWNVMVYTAIFGYTISKSQSFPSTTGDWTLMENSHFFCRMLEEHCVNRQMGKHKYLNKNMWKCNGLYSHFLLYNL